MSTPAIIAIVDFTVNATDRPAALARLGRERSAVRSMPGCVDFRFFQSSEDPTAITVLHEWTDQESFGGYLSSDTFARFGDDLRPRMTAAPSSRRFDAELIDTVA